MSLSSDHRMVVFAGYNVPAGSSSSAIDSSGTTGSGAVPRAVASVRSDGSFTLNATTTAFSGGTIRSAAADGLGNFWAGGGNSGIVYWEQCSGGDPFNRLQFHAQSHLCQWKSLLLPNRLRAGLGCLRRRAPDRSHADGDIKHRWTGAGTPSPKGFAVNAALTIADVADNRTSSTGGGIQPLQ